MKRAESSSSPLAGQKCSTSPSTSPPISTRNRTQTFDANACVICNKRWMKGKEPTCKVATDSSQQAIIAMANKLNRDDILLRLIGQEHDMVANGISYHAPCMNAFKATRIPTDKSVQQNMYDIAFNRLVLQLEVPLFEEKRGVLVKSVRDQYRAILLELGVKTADTYQSVKLKWKLQQRFGKGISILNQSCGSGFICASSVPLGDALDRLRILEPDNHVDERQYNLQRAAKRLRTDIDMCRRERRREQTTEVSFPAAEKMVPIYLFNFTAMLICKKTRLTQGEEETHTSGRLSVDEPTKEKALIVSQQLIQHVSGIATPLGIATAYHVYNHTRSKALITLNNRLGTGISYDTLQRQLTSQCATIMQQMDQDGVYIPENMSHNQSIEHVFAMENLDWKKKTLEGGTFNATTAIIVENIGSVTCEEAARRFSDVRIPDAASCRRKTLSCISNTTIPVCYISARDRQTSRNLTNIERVGMLDTTSDNSAKQLLLIWRLGRCVVTSQLLHVPYEGDVTLPGFSAFCARQLEHKQASKIGYLPLIPASPTYPAVLKEEMA